MFVVFIVFRWNTCPKLDPFPKDWNYKWWAPCMLRGNKKIYSTIVNIHFISHSALTYAYYVQHFSASFPAKPKYSNGGETALEFKHNMWIYFQWLPNSMSGTKISKLVHTIQLHTVISMLSAELTGIKVLAAVSVAVATVLTALAVFLCLNRNKLSWNCKGDISIWT